MPPFACSGQLLYLLFNNNKKIVRWYMANIFTEVLCSSVVQSRMLLTDVARILKRDTKSVQDQEVLIQGIVSIY